MYPLDRQRIDRHMLEARSEKHFGVSSVDSRLLLQDVHEKTGCSKSYYTITRAKWISPITFSLKTGSPGNCVPEWLIKVLPWPLRQVDIHQNRSYPWKRQPLTNPRRGCITRLFKTKFFGFSWHLVAHSTQNWWQKTKESRRNQSKLGENLYYIVDIFRFWTNA